MGVQSVVRRVVPVVPHGGADGCGGQRVDSKRRFGNSKRGLRTLNDGLRTLNDGCNSTATEIRPERPDFRCCRHSRVHYGYICI